MKKNRVKIEAFNYPDLLKNLRMEVSFLQKTNKKSRVKGQLKMYDI